MDIERGKAGKRVIGRNGVGKVGEGIVTVLTW
jgi:hypothetical protein